MQIWLLFRFNHDTISIFERMCVWNQVDAAPSSRKLVSIVLRIGRVFVATHSSTGACWCLLWPQLLHAADRYTCTGCGSTIYSYLSI